MIIEPLTVRRADTPEGHHVYEFLEYRYPSVTTITHRVNPPDLNNWRRTFMHDRFSSADEYSTYTSIRGTFVHYAVLSKLSPFPLDGSDLPKLSRWYQWKDILIPEIQRAVSYWDELEISVDAPFFVETPMVHHGIGYAGQPDLAGMVEYDNEKCLTIVDIKTSKRPYKSHFRQVGGYIQMFRHFFPKFFNVNRGLLVYLDPKSDKAHVEEIYPEDIDINIKEFNEILEQFYSIPNIDKQYGLKLPEWRKVAHV